MGQKKHCLRISNCYKYCLQIFEKEQALMVLQQFFHFDYIMSLAVADGERLFFSKFYQQFSENQF